MASFGFEIDKRIGAVEAWVFFWIRMTRERWLERG